MNTSEINIDYSLFNISSSNNSADERSFSSSMQYLFNASKYMVGAAVFPAAYISAFK